MYHYPLYATFDNLIQLMLPLLRLFVHSSQLKRIFLFCRKDLSTASPFDLFLASLHTVCPVWNIYQQNFVSNKLGDYISCCRSCLYISPRLLSPPSLFSTIPTPDFPSSSCWLFPIFNTLPFSFFTTKHISLLPSSFLGTHPSRNQTF